MRAPLATLISVCGLIATPTMARQSHAPAEHKPAPAAAPTKAEAPSKPVTEIRSAPAPKAGPDPKAPAPKPAEPAVTPELALARLQEGNQRFTESAAGDRCRRIEQRDRRLEFLRGATSETADQPERSTGFPLLR